MFGFIAHTVNLLNDICSLPTLPFTCYIEGYDMHALYLLKIGT